MTPREYLTAIQRETPPPASALGDLGIRSYQRLAPRLPPRVREFFDRGQVAIGEVGVLQPNAFSSPVPPQGYAIRVYTGLSRFLFRISRDVHTRVRIWNGTSDEAPIEPSLTVDQTAELLKEAFETFKRDGRISEAPRYAISESQIDSARNLASFAEDFVVAHEIGHILVWLGRGGISGGIGIEDEFEADKLALQCILGAQAAPEAVQGLSLRMAYAGAEFAVRVGASLEHLGYKFGTSHPLPVTRLQRLRAVATALCGGRRGFLRLSTIAFAHDQLLESMESKIAGPEVAATFQLGVTPDRMLSTLSVIIEEVATGHWTVDHAVEEIQRIFSFVPEDSIQTAIKEASDIFMLEEPGGAKSQDPNFNLKERAVFKAFSERMPERFKAVVEAALRATSAHKPGPDDVLSTIKYFVRALIADGDINELIVARPVAGKTGQFQVVFEPKGPQKTGIVKAARDYLSLVDTETRHAAEARVGEVFEQGTVEFSLMLSLFHTAH